MNLLDMVDLVNLVDLMDLVNLMNLEILVTWVNLVDLIDLANMGQSKKKLSEQQDLSRKNFPDKGQMASPKRMIFRKSSKRPLTLPPSFSENHIADFFQNS